MGVAVIIACWEHSLRERAYYKWVRGAPFSDHSFPVRYSFREIFERMAAAKPLKLLVLTTATRGRVRELVEIGFRRSS